MGYICNDNFDSNCEPCAAGKFTEQLGSTSCTPCGAGKWSPPESAACFVCDAGKIPNDSKSACEPCLRGSVSVPGVSFCSICDHTQGFVAPRDEMHACEFCNYGKKAVAGPTHECVSCGASTYSLGGTDECTPCTGVGKFSTEGAAYCQTALAGTRANEGRTDFEICPIDTFSEVSEAAEERTARRTIY